MTGGEPDLIARLELSHDATADDMVALIHGLSQTTCAGFHVDRVHDPADDEPDFYVLRRPYDDGDA